MGGFDANSGGGQLNDVQYAPINSNGTIGTWVSMAAGLPGGYVTGGIYEGGGREGQTSVAYNGYLYLIGGEFNTGGNYDDVQYAPINSNGTIGPWSLSNTISGGRTEQNAAIYKGYLYMLGGTNNSGTTYNDVQYAPLNTTARTGQYSTLVNLGAASIPQSITYDGQLASGISNVSYRLAGSDGVFGSVQSASSLPLAGGGSAPSCNTATDGGDTYLELIVDFDDSQTATLPDASGNNSYLADITVNYSGLHAAPNVRLRNGEYFSADTSKLQPLDTCH
jgi:hypothetical protein